MTSFWNILIEYLATCAENKVEINTKTRKWAIETLTNKSDVEKKFGSGMKEFLELNHTIGNFIPVPEEFNKGRSGGGNYDCWDLTLDAIYCWYGNNDLNKSSIRETNDKDLEEMFGEKDTHSRRKKIKHCKEWLQIFGNWDDFVEQNYLQDFVRPETKDEKIYGRPIIFWDGHSFKEPLEGINFEQLFGETAKNEGEGKGKTDSINFMIRRRGKRICRVLNNNMKKRNMEHQSN